MQFVSALKTLSCLAWNQSWICYLPFCALRLNVMQCWLLRKYLGKKYLKALLSMTRLVAIAPATAWLISPLPRKFWNVGYVRRHSKIAQMNLSSTNVACRFVMVWWNSHGYHARQQKLRWFEHVWTVFNIFLELSILQFLVSRFGASAKIVAAMSLKEFFMKLPNTYRHIATWLLLEKRVLEIRYWIEESSWIWFIHQMIHQFSPFWTPSCPSALLVSAASWFPSHRGSLQDLVRDAWHGETWKCHKNFWFCIAYENWHGLAW